jgi:hypothetical protein
VIRFIPQLLYYSGNILGYPADKKLDGPHSWTGRSGEEKNSCIYQKKTSVVESAASHFRY